MKKILLVAAIITASVASFAQTTSNSNLKVNLADIMTIEVLTKDVTINITTAADYINAAENTGVKVSMPGHLKVVSNGGFKVKAASGNLQGSSSAGIIESDKIQLDVVGYTKSSNSTSGELTGLTQALGHNLATSAANALISTAQVGGGTVGTVFNVDYTLKNLANIANLPVDEYKTTITYTIEAN